MHLLIAMDNSPLNKQISGFLKAFLGQLKESPRLSFIHVIDSSITHITSRYPDLIMNYEVSAISHSEEETLIRQLRKDAAEMIGDIQSRLGVIGTVDFPIDDPFDAIEKACKENEPDFLVVGTHSRKGINHLLFGNFAEKVLRNLRVPIIIISEKSRVGVFSEA